MNKKTVIMSIIICIFSLAAGWFFFSSNGSQTVGTVTVDRSAGEVEIKEVTEPRWNTASISPVIGKAYKIEKLKKDADPVRVEFSYNISELPTGIPETSLKLFKWNEENALKYWAPIKSRVDVARHVVVADITSFSILAIKAPVSAYLASGEIDSITDTLKKMENNVPPYTCGVSISIDEELNAPDLSYSREGDADRVEVHDCRNSESVKIEDASFNINRVQDGKEFVYVLHVLVEWQTDPGKSITLEGTVRNQRGRAVEGANISATKVKYDRLEGRTATDKNGHFNLKLHAGTYSVDVSSEKPKCRADKWRGDLCLWGLLADPPVRRDIWNKDFTMECPEYIIHGDETMTSTRNHMGGLVSRNVTNYITEGHQQTKDKNGFGWEGAWKMSVTVKDRSDLIKRAISVGGGTVTIPNITSDDGYTYDFNFSIPAKPVVGSAVAMPGVPVKKEKSESRFEAGPMTYSGEGGSFTYNKEEYVDNDEITLPPIVLNGRFVDVGDYGATIQCDRFSTEPKGLTLKIERQGE